MGEDVGPPSPEGPHKATTLPPGTVRERPLSTCTDEDQARRRQPTWWSGRVGYAKCTSSKVMSPESEWYGMVWPPGRKEAHAGVLANCNVQWCVYDYGD